MALQVCGEMTSKIPWPRVLAEGAVIVGSILLALSLEAWVADRDVRRELSADLEGIAGELESNLRLLDFDLDLLRRTVAATGSLVASLNEDPDAPLVAVSDTVAGMARLVSPMLVASVGGVDALIASGRLAAVRSPELRRRLAGLSSLVDKLKEGEDLGRDIGWQQLNPAVARRADLAVGYVIAELFGTRVPGLPLHSRSMVSHPNSSEIRSYLRARGGWYGQAIRDAERLHLEMTELGTLIGTELEGLD
jgi:hypothetical protein